MDRPGGRLTGKEERTNRLAVRLIAGRHRERLLLGLASALAAVTLASAAPALGIPQSHHARAAQAAGGYHGLALVGEPLSPTVTKVDPDAGPQAGGTRVTITGTSLLGATGVSFGSTRATTFEVRSETEIVAVSPAGAGPVEVTVTTPGGESDKNAAADQFTYGPSQIVTNVQPNAGPEVGTTRVIITGTHLLGAASVRFGSNSATEFTVSSETSLTAVAPAGTGTVNVTVESAEGASEPSPADQFHYRAATAGIAWGRNGLGTLGDGTTTNSDVPVAVSGLGTEVTALAAGGEHSLALLADGHIMAWGRNQWGQLGNGATSSDSDEPVTVTGITNAIAVAAGEYDSLALLKTGRVVAWGLNDDGQLGIGSMSEYVDEPTEVPLSEEAVGIAVGSWHSVALLRSGQVAAWGLNEGELGYGTLGPEGCRGPLYCTRSAVAVPGLSEVTAVAAGGEHSLALLKSGHVMAWGYNGSGELGDGSIEESPVPVEVEGLAGVTAIAAGAAQSQALLSNGTVKGWGYNGQEELGDGSTESSDVPVEVNELTEVSAIAGGWDDAVAVLDNGHVKAWGWNEWGDLGNATTTNSGTPVEVTELSEVTAISASQFGLAAGALG